MIRAWILIIAVLAGCRSKDDGSVARLESATAIVERLAAPDAAWLAAQPGDKFMINSAVRTGEASKARLVVGRGGILELEANALVRFVSDPNEQKKSDLRVEAGNVEIEAGEEPLAFGNARLEPRGKARLTASSDGVRIEVAVGQVILEDGEAVRAGTSVTIKIGGAILEQVGAKPAPPDAAVAIADAAIDDAAADVAAAVGGTHVVVQGKPARYRIPNADGRANIGWQPLPVGEHDLGDGASIDAPAGSKVRISRDGSQATLSGGSEVKLTAADNPAMVALIRGSLTIDTESGKGSVALVGGSVVLESGQVHAQMIKGGTEIEARRGDAVIRSTIAEETLQEGDMATLDPSGKVTFQNRAPGRVVFSFSAGESPTIHDAAAPTPVRVRFGACTGGRLEVAPDARFKRILARAGGRSSGNVLLAPGSYAYRVKCEGGKVVRGGVRVVKDSGRKPLPRTAPRTLVEPDGREYVISYQNLLPELTLVWRDAPPRASYQFVIQPASGESKRLKSATPRLSLKSGELGEGNYKFWVEIPETGGRSAEARIIIDFDNAAATASIEKVQVKEGGKVQVRGTVIVGTSVSAASAPLSLDRHQRFDAELAPDQGDDGVAIRIAHPKLGVHYYVLRLKK